MENPEIQNAKPGRETEPEPESESEMEPET